MGLAAIDLLPGAWEQAERLLKDHPDTNDRFNRVADLIQGFETPYGMELLATVHWVATREGAASADEAIRKAYEWNPRKKRFRSEHLRLAWTVLVSKGWLPPPRATM